VTRKRRNEITKKIVKRKIVNVVIPATRAAIRATAAVIQVIRPVAQIPAQAPVSICE
jgi:hypothetical protein